MVDNFVQKCLAQPQICQILDRGLTTNNHGSCMIMAGVAPNCSSPDTVKRV